MRSAISYLSPFILMALAAPMVCTGCAPDAHTERTTEEPATAAWSAACTDPEPCAPSSSSR